MTELGTALRERAGDGVAPHAVDPDDLWRRGRTRVWRNRGIGLVAAAVVVATALVSTSSVPEPHTAMPVGRVHAPAIPKNIYEPNRFLARISDTGPPGQLAVIAHGGHGWFGISATTGRYTALDLPGLATDAPVALSPDGNRIAYGVTGPTRKKTFGPPTPINEGGPLPKHPMVGYAVYDLRDGSVVKHIWTTDYGFSILGENPLVWLGENRIEFGYDVATGSNTADLGDGYVWDVDRGNPRRLVGDSLDSAQYVPTYDPSRYVRIPHIGQSVMEVTDAQGRPTGGTIRIKDWDGGGPSSVSMSPRHVVLTGAYGPGNQQRVSSAPRPSGTALDLSLRPLGRIVAPFFLGWTSPSVVLVTGRTGVLDDSSGFVLLPGGGEGDDRSHLYDVDLDARKVREIGFVDGQVDGTVQVARSLLAEPLVPGRKPPSVVAALQVPLGVGGVVLLGALGGVLLVRRRRRA